MGTANPCLQDPASHRAVGSGFGVGKRGLLGQLESLPVSCLSVVMPALTNPVDPRKLGSHVSCQF